MPHVKSREVRNLEFYGCILCFIIALMAAVITLLGNRLEDLAEEVQVIKSKPHHTHEYTYEKHAPPERPSK